MERNSLERASIPEGGNKQGMLFVRFTPLLWYFTIAPTSTFELRTTESMLLVDQSPTPSLPLSLTSCTITLLPSASGVVQGSLGTISFSRNAVRRASSRS